MRLLALSDVHLDYEENRRWLSALSETDYVDDALILAGDVSHSIRLIGWCFERLARRFGQVLYVPGNHDLWVLGDERDRTSLDKFWRITQVAADAGVMMRPCRRGGVSIVPLLGWYDYSFGDPPAQLSERWADHRACIWPEPLETVASYFAGLNEPLLDAHDGTVVTFSHFLPRIDLMPAYIPASQRLLYPVLGTVRLERQLRRLKSAIHVYGHSHVNRRVEIDGVLYVNNAFGYPSESHIAAKRLVCVHG